MPDKGKRTGETRAGEVLIRMRRDIINCVLKPNEKLRFEALRKMYSVSFSTLREALSRLAAENHVISEGQRGFVVAPVSIADLHDLTNARVLVEREALRLAIENGDDRWEDGILAVLHRMDRLQQRLGKEYYLVEEWAKVHSEFHRSLVAASGSPILIEIRQNLFERANRYRRMSSQFRTKWREKTAEHKMIADAAVARDSANALRLIDRHIRETTKNVIKYAGHLFPEENKWPRAAAAE
jgi:GntR family carbon starvation induced transcriptional regulator